MNIATEFCIYEIVMVPIFNFQTYSFDIWEQMYSKKVFPVKNKKNKPHHWILHIRISLAVKFQFKRKILIFWTKFVQKEGFWSKTEKMNITIEFCIHEVVLVPNFSLNWQFWILD